MTEDGIKHGTYAGYQRHKKTGVPICVECREANRLYHAAYRSQTADYRAREKLMNRARNRAVGRLAALHPGQFDALIAQELRAELAS